MTNELILRLLFGGWAALLLLAMMRRRQQALDGLLHTYVVRETQSAARRRKAARLTDKATAKAQAEETAKPE